MIEPNEGFLETTAEPKREQSPGTSAPGSISRPMRMSVIGLVIAVLALGLAMIPALAMERPLPNPFANPEKEQPQRVEPPPEREGGVTLKFKDLSINVGGKVAKKDEEKPIEQEIKITKDPARWFTISAIGCALIGLVVAGIAQIRERHLALTISTMGCATAAITWQYFAIGIAIGAAAAAFLILLAILGSALG